VTEGWHEQDKGSLQNFYYTHTKYLGEQIKNKMVGACGTREGEERFCGETIREKTNWKTLA